MLIEQTERSALKTLYEREDVGRVWPIRVDGQHIGYIVLTKSYSLDFVGDDAGHSAQAQAVLDRNREPGPLNTQVIEPVEQLTTREQEVLQLIADGLSNQAIADKLFLSVGTVKAYTSQIYGKLGVNSRTMAIVRARQLGLLRDVAMQFLHAAPVLAG